MHERMFVYGRYAPELASRVTTSETQGADSGGEESLNGRKNMARRKVKNGSARLDFSLPPLSAPGWLRMTSVLKQLI